MFGTLTASCNRPARPQNEIDAAQVAGIVARINFTPDDGPLIDPYEAAAGDIPRVLGLLKDGVREPVAATNWMPLGQLDITMKDRRVVTVIFYWTGGARGAYRIGDSSFRGSSDKAFRDTIAACAQRGLRQ